MHGSVHWVYGVPLYDAAAMKVGDSDDNHDDVHNLNTESYQ